MYTAIVIIFILVILFFVNQRWAAQSELDKLSNNLDWDNEEILRIENSLPTPLGFNRGNVMNRTILYREVDNKLQLIKIKRRRLRIGYGVDWYQKKKYAETLVNLGAIENEDYELFGTESFFYFREMPNWETDDVEHILDVVFMSPAMMAVEKRENLNLLADFDHYKSLVEKLKEEPLI